MTGGIEEPRPDQAHKTGEKPRIARQAVVIVHGMGEQRPMDTVRNFVSTVWEKDPTLSSTGKVDAGEIWSRPDSRTGSLELRRITTRKSRKSQAFPSGVRTDFYELYWADLTAGSTWQQFVNWIHYLLLRPSRLVPRDVRLAWIALWMVSLFVILLTLPSLVPENQWTKFAPSWTRYICVILAALFTHFAHRAATASFGRVVKYTRSEPDNIAARAAVRERGLKLLDELHWHGEYSRVIIVGHSLGTILAYDLISYYWARRAAARTVLEGTEEFKELCAVQKASADLKKDSSSLGALRMAQANFRRSLARRPAPTKESNAEGANWLISDLVTIGSPLTHAEFLLASGPEDLARRVVEREYPVSPPQNEPLNDFALWKAIQSGLLPATALSADLFAFPVSDATEPTWQLHHAAPFAAVRWTNIFDPSHLVYQGDLVSGPMQENFGAGVKDVDLRNLRGQSKRFSHTLYWDPKAPASQLKAVRDAVNILDE